MGDWQVEKLAYQPSSVTTLFRHLLAYDYPVWLDSCAHGSLGRFDILTADPVNFVTGDNAPQFYTSLREAVSKPLALNEAINFSGLIGYISYEMGMSHFDISPKQTNKNHLPLAWFGIYDWAVIIDHHLKCTYLVNRSKPATFLNEIKSIWSMVLKTASSMGSFRLTSRLCSNMNKEEYDACIDKIQAHLQAGDSYQVNFTHSFNASFRGDPFDAYLALRQANPAEYSAFMRFPKADILSFSPELLIKATGTKLLARPIKGTAARYDEPVKDKLQMKVLKSCPKNRAENMMIVDLLRNDLSRVSTIDSVKVPQFLSLETLPSVFHLVSTIESQLRNDCDYIDVLKAVFPGGSITGAPKKSTMKIINQLEKSQRGIYCGSIGYLSPNLDMCFNIAIRTLTATDGHIYCPAGGGIVLDSESEAEYQETLDKVAILKRTLSELGI